MSWAFFPAEANGGLPVIKAMSAPYNKMKFMPTGGITAKNITSYLDFKKIIACGGSWMVNGDMVKTKDWEGITRLTKEAVATMLGFTMKHVGINNQNEGDAQSQADKFASIFGVEKAEGNSSIFVNQMVEVMKGQGKGKNGHIAVGTNYVDRAVYHLEKRGFTFDESSKQFNEDGTLKFIYFTEEIGGFAIHLTQNK